MIDDIELQIHELLTDAAFLELRRFQNRPNLFGTVAASHMEMWHSAFVKWLIDPSSHLGLGDFPLKRFVFAVLHFGQIAPTADEMPTLTLGELEAMILHDMEFATEHSFAKAGNKRIDIIGVLEDVPVSYSNETTSIRIIIE